MIFPLLVGVAPKVWTGTSGAPLELEFSDHGTVIATQSFMPARTERMSLLQSLVEPGNVHPHR